ncbi:hypothetical protein GCM10022397_13170 [Flavivirga jejuensis]
MKITVYNLGEPERFVTRVYEDNKPKTDSFYDINNKLTNYFNWTYNNGKLSSNKGYLPDKTLTYEFTISYDDMERITKTIKTDNNNITTTNFIYNSDNTITSIREFNNNSSTKTFFTNNLGLIYKETSDNDSIEVIYDNDNNVTTITSNFGIVNLTYDNINLPPKNFPVYENFMFGVNKNNYIIYGNSLNMATNNEASILPKFVLKYERGSDTNIQDWTLDNENYPINKKYYTQNQLEINYDFIYNQ